MGDSYLTLAQAVLEARAKPLTAQEILLDARKFELLPQHLSGDTMQKTLQARLAEDIFKRRNKSLFYRTAVGTYFLRSLANDRTLPAQARQEYKPRTRGQPDPLGRVLFVHAGIATGVSTFLTRQEFAVEEVRTAYHSIELPDPTGFAVLTFTVIVYRDQCLVHQVGRYSMFKDEVGRHTVGFRRFVDEFDTDLFNSDPFGVELSARREVSRILGSQPAYWLPGTAFKQLGVVLQPRDRTALFVVRASLPADREPPSIGRRLGVSCPRWHSIGDVDYSNLDTVSVMTLAALERR